ncbi:MULTISPECIES: hypothetical protein [Micromonospora]|uniref:Uncharacterized protein n=1 Tax=Micromonospora solifontis TaxID=2487138 RepID=A0ABX9WHX1_9ACTN|nr:MULTISPECIES: hypothetical protein [Micromonospora]NES15963.1 hypothetical protein [Micromonospora sp. PPF5-17B]NES36616.1 hypothetical protein [Micromonospora solifontis]NES57366.1 hypothetical protein [Micromonospora sp. PPF5-6]RNL99354.1 hypothetical protein EFE23_10650 [Micromonospora solifontis]
MEHSTGYLLAVDAVTRHVNSARPDAPVRPDRPRTPRLAPTRLAAAGALRRLADLMEPRPAAAPTCLP